MPPFEDEDDEAVAPDGHQEDADQEEEEGEHLFGDDMENDYRPMPGLDRYVCHSKYLRRYYGITQPNVLQKLSHIFHISFLLLGMIVN